MPTLTVQEFSSALSVPTTVAARPLSARSLLRTLRLTLCDGGGRAGTGSATPSIILAFAPASRFAIISLISSIPRSNCSSVIALTPPECSNFQLFRDEHGADLQVARRALPPHPLEHFAPMLLPVLRQIEQKALVERSARSLRRAARVSREPLARTCR